MSETLNRATAHEIAQGIAIHKEAQDCVAERIFTALQIAQKRGEILADRAPAEIPEATRDRLESLKARYFGEKGARERMRFNESIIDTEQTLREMGVKI